MGLPERRASRVDCLSTTRHALARHLGVDQHPAAQRPARPGENQTAAAIEPFLDKAARQLGVDRVAIRRVNAPDHDGKIGGKQEPITSSYLRQALAKGAERFNWTQKASLSGQRQGSKVTGIGVGVAYHSAGQSGFDGLVVLKPDGKLYIHNGPGNLGTFSYAATARTAAEVLGMPWEHCEIVYGDTSRHLPWNLGQFGSNTSFTMTRTNYVAAMDAKRKLQAIAAREFGETLNSSRWPTSASTSKRILPRASAWPTRRSVPLLWAVYTVARAAGRSALPDR